MSWILDGMRVNANYMGEYPVAGVVLESRVKYGGEIQYTVKLDKPVKFPWRDETRDVVLIEGKLIERISS